MYKKHLLLTFTLVILGLFQTSFLFELFGEVNPNIILALVFAFLYASKTEDALFSAFVGGLIIDLMTSNILGISSLALVVFTLAAGLVRKYAASNMFSQSIMCISTALLYSVVTNFNVKLNFSGVLFSSTLTLLVSIVIYLVVNNFGNERKPF